MPLTKPSLVQLLGTRKRSQESDTKNKVLIQAVAKLPTLFGQFDLIAFTEVDGLEHVALLHGDVTGKEEVPVRVHSECLTSESFGSLRCDCREQLDTSMKKIVAMGGGAILYLRQEGRGIGLLNKIKAYQIEDFGYDTYEANEMLGFKDDERDYKIAADMLTALQISSIQLMTNNPAKRADLTAHGVQITGIIGIEIPPNKYDTEYLEAKKKHNRHMLDDLFSNS
jgi:GTP cyclohydrolase II